VAASQSIRTLKVCMFDNISVQEIAALTNLDTNLERLELPGCIFEMGAFTALMAALMPNGRLHGLQKLRLCGCDIGTRSAKVEEIAQMLRSNTSIKVLDLSDSIDDNTIGDEGATLLSDALSSNNTVTNLDLSACRIGTVGAIASFLLVESEPLGPCSCRFATNKCKDRICASS
jgi:Ran GTPase-activating protein (RanGAP) involved in mRNA processing and transport